MTFWKCRCNAVTSLLQRLSYFPSILTIRPLPFRLAPHVLLWCLLPGMPSALFGFLPIGHFSFLECAKFPLLGGIGGRRRRGWQRMRWLEASPIWWTWLWVNSGSWWWTGSLACWGSWGCKESDMTERLNWTELTCNTMRLKTDFCMQGRIPLNTNHNPYIINNP